MPLPLVPIILGVVGTAGAVGTAIVLKKKIDQKNLEPAAKLAYDNVIASGVDVPRTMALAEKLAEDGFVEPAAVLERRAQLPYLEPEIKAAHFDAYQRGMQSNDAQAVQALSQAFAEQGAVNVASALAAHAEEVRPPDQAPPSEAPKPDKFAIAMPQKPVSVAKAVAAAQAPVKAATVQRLESAVSNRLQVAVGPLSGKAKVANPGQPQNPFAPKPAPNPAPKDAKPTGPKGKLL